MSETPGERPRPTPRPRAERPRPSPRPRVAGSRRDREEPRPDATPTATGATTSLEKPASGGEPRAGSGTSARRTRPARTRPAPAAAPARSRRLSPVAVLGVLCVLAAGAVAFLAWQRLHPTHVSPEVFAAAREDVQALYAYDYQDSEGSVQRKLDVLTGDLREQYETDLSQGGIVDTYEQVSATTRYEVLDVGLQQVSDDQDTATVVVFGQYVVQSVNSGTQTAPEGSECTVTPEGAQSCTQTVQVQLTRVDGDWKISDLTLLTTS
ncbi:hypothetical protein GCM10027451_22120 [Geodermatophilus aquaeductus]|uniref:Mce-associated membrane protein n=1 Tax=Geodermatophilus aquaeductus TaxID=1564161 RepID=A0A521AN31_9ACTN|nr:hypothetical protein [Geodermatophilus aquaeductus]SMO36216.1 hypothetical protein SAMN06273567_101218 [Geodermatophilus aquaeductus]